MSLWVSSCCPTFPWVAGGVLRFTPQAERADAASTLRRTALNRDDTAGIVSRSTAASLLPDRVTELLREAVVVRARPPGCPPSRRAARAPTRASRTPRAGP